MKRINLRELYPDYYQTDIFIDIPEEVLAVIAEETRAEAAAKRQTYRYRAQYSLDVGDGIEEAKLYLDQLSEAAGDQRPAAHPIP